MRALYHQPMRTARDTSPKVVLAIMLVGTFVAAASQSMLASSLPAIMADFGIDATLGQMLTTFDVFTIGIIAALSASLIARYNTRYLFLGALVLFLAGCMAAYFAPSYWTLLGSRILQAIAAGVLLPLNQVVALAIYPKDKSGRALGLVGLVFGAAPVIAPTLSGIITDTLGWRDIFLLLALIALLALIGGAIAVRDMGRHEKMSFDRLGALMYSAGLVLFMLGMTGLEEFSFSHPADTALIIAGVVMLVVFTVRQLKVKDPYLKLSLFKRHRFALGMILLLLAQVAMMSSALQVPLYIQEVHGLTAIDSGLMLLPGALCLPILNPFTGRLYDRVGARPMGMVGFSLLFLGTVPFIFFSSDTTPWLISLMYMARMAGVAFTLMPMTAFCLSDLSKDENPQGTAIMNSFRQIAGSLGSSGMIGITTAFSVNAEATAGVSMAGFSISFGVQAALLLTALLLVVILVRPKRKAVETALPAAPEDGM